MPAPQLSDYMRFEVERARYIACVDLLKTLSWI